MNTTVTFEIAKLLKEKGFDKQATCFYAKKGSKVFGIDEHGRYYPIKHLYKTLFVCGNAAVLNENNAYLAPTIAETVMWLHEKHDIWIHVCYMTDDKIWWWDCYKYKKENGLLNHPAHCKDFNLQSPTEAYQSAIEYCLKEIIK